MAKKTFLEAYLFGTAEHSPHIIEDNDGLDILYCTLYT